MQWSRPGRGVAWRRYVRPLAGCAQRRAASRRHARGRAAADPGRRRHGQDDHAVLAARLARGRGRAVGAHPAAHVHPPGGAGDARSAPAGARAGRERGACSGGTFHSVAHRLVRRHASALGLPGGFGVLDAGDAADVLDLAARGARPRAGADAASRARPRCWTSTRARSTPRRRCPSVLAEHFPWCERAQARRSRRCSRPTRRASGRWACSTSTTCCCSGARWPRDEVIGPRLAGAFDHVLVDEYQDVNGLQVDLVRGLAGHGAGVTAVGDDFQAIYGFRSASADHILDFPAALPGHARGHAGAQLPRTQPLLDVGQRASPPRRRARSRSTCGPSARAASGPRSCTAATSPRRPRGRGPRARRRARRAPSCGPRPC